LLLNYQTKSSREKKIYFFIDPEAVARKFNCGTLFYALSKAKEIFSCIHTAVFQCRGKGLIIILPSEAAMFYSSLIIFTFFMALLSG
jgi:hypothetical protein